MVSDDFFSSLFNLSAPPRVTVTDDVDMIAATRCGATKAWQDYGETNGKVNKIEKRRSFFFFLFAHCTVSVCKTKTYRCVFMLIPMLSRSSASASSFSNDPTASRLS